MDKKTVDLTTKDTVPDFESGRAYYWMKQTRELMEQGTPLNNWPRKPRKNKAEHSFWNQVDRRLSRRAYTVSIAFDKETGKIIREEEAS